MTVIQNISNTSVNQALAILNADGENHTGTPTIANTVTTTTAPTSTWNADAGDAMELNQNNCFTIWYTNLVNLYPNHSIDTDDIVARFTN